MIELLGVISAIIAILGFGWGIMKFVLRPYFDRRKDYDDIERTIKDRTELWKAVNYTARGNPFLDNKDFSRVNTYRKKFKKTRNKEKLAFLLRNAVQLGMEGDWGYWLTVNDNNDKIVDGLIPALDGSVGQRPIWRAAFILEKAYGDHVDILVNRISNKARLNNSSIVTTLSTTGVKKYLDNLSKGEDESIAYKAQKVLLEIDNYSDELDEFVRNKQLEL